MHERARDLGRSTCITTGIPGPRLDTPTRRALEDLGPSGVVPVRAQRRGRRAAARPDGALHALPSRPLVSIDHEGGRVLRLGTAVHSLSARRPTSARAGSEATWAVGTRDGPSSWPAVGIDINFAPVLDVHSNPLNPVIGDRAFSSDPDAAGRLARRVPATASAPPASFRAANTSPGTATTDRDSHLELPIVPRARTELEVVELVPFRAAIADGIPCIDDRPRALSGSRPRPPGDTLCRHPADLLLRDQLGFRGVVVSDDLQMRAVSDRRAVPEAAVAALAAGVDWLLVCNELEPVRPRRSAEHHPGDARARCAGCPPPCRRRGALGSRRRAAPSLPPLLLARPGAAHHRMQRLPRQRP